MYPNTVTVVINGDCFFPWVTRAFAVLWYPGITVYQALAVTGAVRFGISGQIVAVDGVVISGNVGVILRLNGRRIPESLIFLPLQIGDTVALELVVRGPGFPREDEVEDMLAQQQLQESFEYRPYAEQPPEDGSAVEG